MSDDGEPIMFHICQASDMHPYECGQDCIHCRGEKTEHHDPEKCALCRFDEEM